MYTYFVALFGALCWGIAPLFGKMGLRGVNTVDGLAARTIITAVLVAILVLTCGNVERMGTIPLRSWVFLALEAFLATFAGDIAYYVAIKHGDIGRASVVLASSPIITVLIGWIFLGEALSVLKVTGAMLVVVGVILVGLEI